ncbi:hypothetical protein BJ878DRAFT_480554 [Calycina marina]|uniref:Nitrogen regulatory protein areA GATA-like domain-containing protein n=1 Tax=Calycina marina TaxID=1763456 RepID=A0A9P7Z1T2_9HELO|nr:hypothetical protein BJ878DRAFT_480554 [Calycina marina]
MVEERPNLLPKGIVLNAPNVEQSIEREAGAPVDVADIERMWKVYTTTQRRLLDPTAIRLEHFWWRIWGSRSRELTAHTIADLYAHVSHGETFIPLRGPPNRDESGASRPNIPTTGTGSPRPAMPQGDSRPRTTSSMAAVKLPAVSPLPPILKKADAPPPTGPRLSVGFASISNSDVEDEAKDSSSTSAISQAVFDSPAIDSQVAKADKKGKKKALPFVASRGSKKIPVMVRRTSSKSSTETRATLDTTADTDTSKGKDKAILSRFQENFSFSPDTVLTNPNASSTFNARSKAGESSNRSGEGSGYPSRMNVASNGDPGPSTLRSMPNVSTETAEKDLTLEDLEEFEMQKAMLKDFERQKKAKEKADQRAQATGTGLFAVDNDDDVAVLPRSKFPLKPSHTAAEASDKIKQRRSPKRALQKLNVPDDPPDRTLEKPKKPAEKARLLSQNEAPHELGKGDHRRPPIPSQQIVGKGTASIGEDLHAATGQVGLGSTRAQSAITTSRSQPHTMGNKGKSKVDPMFAKRPVPPSTTNTTSVLSGSIPANSMARSKSQLSLLLEKDRVGRSENKDKENSKKREKE